MSNTTEQLPSNNLKDAITEFVLEQVGGLENVKEAEENCGSMWITLNDGTVYSVSIMECESPD